MASALSRATRGSFRRYRDSSPIAEPQNSFLSPSNKLLGSAFGLTGPALPTPVLTDIQTKIKSATNLVRLNVGGTSYRLSKESIEKRQKVGLLHTFITSTHEERLEMCDEYIEETKEFFFERPAHIFDAIYCYYVTGRRHKPLCIPQEPFAAELAYWQLTPIFAPAVKSSTVETLNHPDPFSLVRFGRVRKAVWNICEEPESSKIAKAFAFASITAVLISNLALVLSTLPSFQLNQTVFVPEFNETVWKSEQEHPVFEYIEMGCIALFTMEYIAKIIVSPRRCRTFCEFMNLVDLIAILPFYIELSLIFFGLDSAEIDDFQGAILVLRILRVLRVIRLLKLGRYSTGLQMFVTVLKRSVAQLGMVFVVVGIKVMFFSTLVYFSEKDGVDTKFDSIPAAFWWCIVTITTVGYGDMYPQTILGKLVASLAIACGMLVLALPITVIVDNFMQVQEEYKLKLSKNKGGDDSFEHPTVQVRIR